MTLIQRIFKLEDKKINLLYKGAEEDFGLMQEIKNIDKKLDRLYNWLNRGYMNGLLD